MAFTRFHGITMAQNSWIENAFIERLANDPTVSEAGRVWFNTTDKLFKFTTLNSTGSVVVRAFATLEELNAYKTDIASTTDGKGAGLVGYRGKEGALGQFTVNAKALQGALDDIVTKIDSMDKVVDDLGSGNLPAMQTEIDTIESAAGLQANGTYQAEPSSNYLNSATSLKNADMLLDAQLKITTDGLATEALTRQNQDALKVNKAGDTMTGVLDMSNHRITNVMDPIDAQDVATKAYVDAVKTGLDPKDSVRVATTENITLSALQTIDGVALQEGDRVLVKDQNDPIQNGIYVVSTTAWTRSEDADGTPANEVSPGMFTFVEEGTLNSNNGYICITTGTITVGTTPINIAQFSGAGQIIAGAGISKNGNELFLNFGAGIAELPGDQIGVEVHPSGAIFTTIDGTTSSTQSAAVLAVKLDGNTLTRSANGLKVSDSIMTDIAGLHTELDNTQAGVGLGSAGSYTADPASNYMKTATTVYHSTQLLDGAIKANADAIAALEADKNNDVADLQSELNVTQAGAGLAADGTFIADGTTNYLGSATSLKDATKRLDAQSKVNADAITLEISNRQTSDNAIQGELDRTQTGAGLASDGTYTADASTVYLTAATSLKDADKKLDAGVKANADAITLETSNRIAGDTALQGELDATQVGAGLGTDGAYTADVATNYINTATTLKNADKKLDAQLKITTDNLATEITNRTTAVAGVQAELDTTQVGAGLGTDGSYVANGTANYIAAATSLNDATIKLDTSLKTVNNAIVTLKSNLNASFMTFESVAAATSHTVTHNLSTNFVSVDVWVKDDDGKYRNDLVGITVEDTNAISIDLTEARFVRCIVRAAATMS